MGVVDPPVHPITDILQNRSLIMTGEQILQKAETMTDILVAHRRALHRSAEVGFDLTHTVTYVRGELEKMGIPAHNCGKAGLVACIGGRKPGKVFLLRADMDALPIRETAEVPFASQNGNMHACGHDLHTAMLLGAAKLLKDCEEELDGTVKLMFQGAEEIFEGSRDMIEAGLLESPKVDAAMMIHVMTAVPIPAGTAIVCAPGVSAPAADYFEITVQGKGCHGSMPHTGVDPLLASAHLLIALEEIRTRELSMEEQAVLTFGCIRAGSAPNVIPDTVTMTGSLRTFDEGTRTAIKARMSELASGIARAFRCEATVRFTGGCPSLFNDAELASCTAQYAKELLGGRNAISVSEMRAGGGGASGSAGSEDFAYISRAVPSIMLALAAGQSEQGYCYPQHHPMARFDESVLPRGSALYAYTALRYLAEHH
jgi:hippurate hydrolase